MQSWIEILESKFKRKQKLPKSFYLKHKGKWLVVTNHAIQRQLERDADLYKINDFFRDILEWLNKHPYNDENEFVFFSQKTNYACAIVIRKQQETNVQEAVLVSWFGDITKLGKTISSFKIKNPSDIKVILEQQSIYKENIIFI